MDPYMLSNKTCGSCPVWERFDRRSLLCFTGYTERFRRMADEIGRVGMCGVDIQWQFPDPFEKTILNNLSHEDDLAVGGYMNCTMGHYHAIKAAYHLGLESIFVMEDDIRFLNDTEEMSRAVESLPRDFDIAMFDCFPAKGIKPSVMIGMRDSRKINEFWAEFDDMYSMGCYAMSRKAMERYIWLNEAAVLKPSIGKLRVCDHFLSRKYFRKDTKMYFARKNIAVQKASMVSNTEPGRIMRAYSGIGIDLSSYAE